MSAILSKPECVFNVSDFYLMESKDGIYGSIHQMFDTCNCDIHVFKQCSIQKDPNALLSFPGYNFSKYHIEIGWEVFCMIKEVISPTHNNEWMSWCLKSLLI